MSWVVSKHICKSGGNGIYNRIGNYNKHSSKRCQTLRHIYKSTAASIKKNLKDDGRGKNNIYDVIDEYINRTRLFTFFRKRVSCGGTYYRTTHQPYYTANNNYNRAWRVKYTKSIVDKISDRALRNNSEQLKLSHQRFYDTPSLTTKEHEATVLRIDIFLPMTLSVIATNKKYSSLQEILKSNFRMSLVEEVINKCEQRFLAPNMRSQFQWREPHSE